MLKQTIADEEELINFEPGSDGLVPSKQQATTDLSPHYDMNPPKPIQTWNRMGWTSSQQGLLPAKQEAKDSLSPLYDMSPPKPRQTWNRIRGQRPNTPGQQSTEVAVQRPSPRQSGNHKSMDYPSCLKQESETIGSIESPLQSAQKVGTRLKQVLLRNMWALAGSICTIVGFAVFLHACAVQNSVNAYRSAVTQFDQHYYYGAIKSLQQSIAFDHDSSGAYLLRGKCYECTGNFKRAFDDYSHAVQIDAGNVDALQARATLGSRLGRSATTIDDLTMIERLKPDLLSRRPQNLINFSCAYLQKGQTEFALAKINECLHHHRHNAEALIQRARCYEAKASYGRALADCAAAVEIDPASAKALVEQGRVHELLGDYKQDLLDFNKAIQLDPKLSVAYACRSAHFAHFNKLPAALKDINQAIDLQVSGLVSGEVSGEELADLYLTRAALCTGCGDFRAALKDYERISSMSGFRPGAEFFAGRATVKTQLKDYSGALNDLKLAANGNSQRSHEYMIARADLFASRKKYAEAIAQLDRVLAQNPDNAAALLKHGLYSQLSNNKITAMEDYCKAIKADPRNAQAYYLRATAFLAERQFESAAADLKEAMALNPSLEQAREKLRMCLKEMKRSTFVSITKEARKKPLSKSELEQIANLPFPELLSTGYKALEQQRLEYALAALTRAVRMNRNDRAARQYLFYALVGSRQSDLATTQLLAIEKIGGESISEDLSMINALVGSGAGAVDQGRDLADHLIERRSSDSKTLALIAQSCLSWGYDRQAKVACDKGLAQVCEPDTRKALRDMRDKAIAMTGAPKPVERSIYSAGAGEPTATP